MKSSSPSYANALSGLREHAVSLYTNSFSKRALRRYLNFQGRAQIDDRSKGRASLCYILAGYKPELWPLIFPRLARFVPPDHDVCVVCAGSHHPELDAICRRNNWSFLSVARNSPSLAMNLAIRHHPSARWLFKFDEDIVIGANYFDGMRETWQKIEGEKRYDPGILAPLLNVNGYSSRIFLEKEGRLADFIAKFGEARQSTKNTAAWSDPEAAAYLWELARPFDDVAAKFYQHGIEYSACPHQFSIGAFLMPRTFWSGMGGFTVGGPGQLGVDEADLAAYGMCTSQVIACAHHVLAGHVGFGPQTAAMIEKLKERPDLYL
jgi:hypothetical protein